MLTKPSLVEMGGAIMLEFKDLDEGTMLDGFCVKPSHEWVEWNKERRSNLEEAQAERRRFLSDRLAEGTVWGKIAYKNSKPVGWIDCFPTDVDGWAVIGCMGIEEGFGGQGIGRALVEAVIEEAKKRGLKGLTVGATVWDHMPKAFFAKYGFVDTDEKADMSGMNLKLEDVGDPQFPPEEDLYAFKPVPGKVVIDLMRTGGCPTPYLTHYFVKKAAERFKDKVIVNEYATSEADVVERFGKGGGGMYFNGESAFFGYPGELDDIVAYLQKKVDELEK
jgi:GNAT superfamily N-acetyltransferase